MKREIHVCDRCGAEAETDEDKKVLGLAAAELKRLPKKRRKKT